MPAVKVLFVGVEDALQNLVYGEFKSCLASKITNSNVFFDQLEKITDETQDLIFIGSQLEGVAPLELAQALRMQAAGTQIYFIAYQGKFQDHADLEKNGVNQSFYIPIDKELLSKTARHIESLVGDLEQPNMESVPVVDLEANVQMDFEVSIFLPMNNRYVKLNRKGSALKETQLKKMDENAVSQVFLDERDVDKFLAYTTKRLKSLSTGAKSNFEEQRRLQSSVRNLFQDLLTSKPTLNFEEGRDFVSHSQKIIADYVGSSKAFDLQRELSKTICSTNADFYNRSSKVSTLAALFSMATMKGSPESVAIAGLFLDLGKAVLPPELVAKPEEAMTPDEFSKYKTHPQESIRLLQDRKMILANEILDGIVQHHERYDGKGYPKGMPAHRININAQLLYIADHFYDYSVPQPGKPQPHPDAIFARIQSEGGANPELVRELREAIAGKPST